MKKIAVRSLPSLQLLLRHSVRHCLYTCDLSPNEPTVFSMKQTCRINKRTHIIFGMSPNVDRITTDYDIYDSA